MTFTQWDEYVSSKGKVENGKVDISGDQTDPMKPPVSPPGTQGHKPYSASDGKNTKMKEKGFGYEGDADLVFNYEPNADGKAPADIPTAENYRYMINFRNKLRENPNLIESVVREIKRNGLMGVLVGELMEHHETFDLIVELANSKQYGEAICEKFNLAIIKEETAPPFLNPTHQPKN